MTRDVLAVHATRRAARLIALLPMLVALLAVGCASGTGKQPPRAAGPAPGPVLRFQLDGDIESADPARQFTQVSWQIGFATCLKLVNYPDEAGAGGLALEPEAAALIPTPTDGGRIYRFRVRRGFRFSPPSAEPVTAESFRRAIERLLDPRMDSAGAGFIEDIEGAAAFHGSGE